LATRESADLRLAKASPGLLQPDGPPALHPAPGPGGRRLDGPVFLQPLARLSRRGQPEGRRKPRRQPARPRPANAHRAGRLNGIDPANEYPATRFRGENGLLFLYTHRDLLVRPQRMWPVVALAVGLFLAAPSAARAQTQATT